MWRRPGRRTGGAPSWQGLWGRAVAPCWGKATMMIRVSRNDWSTGRSSSSWNLNSSSTTGSRPSSESRWFIAVTLFPWRASTACWIWLQNISLSRWRVEIYIFWNITIKQPKSLDMTNDISISYSMFPNSVSKQSTNSEIASWLDVCIGRGVNMNNWGLKALKHKGVFATYCNLTLTNYKSWGLIQEILNNILILDNVL